MYNKCTCCADPSPKLPVHKKNIFKKKKNKKIVSLGFEKQSSSILKLLLTINWHTHTAKCMHLKADPPPKLPICKKKGKKKLSSPGFEPGTSSILKLLLIIKW